MTPLEVARVALLDLGRPDLAERIAWYDNNDGGFIDVLDEIDPDDHAVLDKAENLARASAPMTTLQPSTTANPGLAPKGGTS